MKKSQSLFYGIASIAMAIGLMWFFYRLWLMYPNK